MAAVMAGTSPGGKTLRNSTVMSHAIAQRTFFLSSHRRGPDGTGQPIPIHRTTRSQDTPHDAAASVPTEPRPVEFGRPVPLLPASPGPASSILTVSHPSVSVAE